MYVEKVCWKFWRMLKTVMQVQNYVEYCKVCWKTRWKFQGMLKTVICVENYVKTACWKFQCVLKMFMLGMLKTVLKYKKATITLHGAWWN